MNVSVHQWQVLSEHHLLITRWRGLVTDDTLLSGYAKIYADPLWAPGFSELADLRDGDLTGVTSGGLTKLAHGIASLLDGVESKSAVLVSNDLGYGLARMYDVFAHESAETVQVFRDPEPAFAWLDLPAHLLE